MIIQLPLNNKRMDDQNKKAQEADELLRKREDISFCIEYLIPQAKNAGLDEVAYLLELAGLVAKDELPKKTPNRLELVSDQTTVLEKSDP